jgi:hypothetical protein
VAPGPDTGEGRGADPADAESSPPTPPIDAGWHTWGFSPEASAAWRSAGVTDPEVAKQWEIAQVTPATIDAWREGGLDSRQAVRAFRLGYDIDAVRELTQHGGSVDQEFDKRFDTSPTVFHRRSAN